MNPPLSHPALIDAVASSSSMTHRLDERASVCMVSDHPEMRLVARRHRVPMPPVGAAIFPDQAWEEIARSLQLSRRELQIVRGVFDDETDRCIAYRIGISLHTVHTHVERLHRKLAVRDRPQLLLCVMQEYMTIFPSRADELAPFCDIRASSRCASGS